MIHLTSNKVGPRKSFSFEDLIIALYSISRGKASRKTLCTELAVGEGVVRTILKELTVQSLVKSNMTGTMITTKGRKELEELDKKFSEPRTFTSSELTYGQKSFAILVNKAANKIKRGLEERDYAIRAGALGALVLVKRNNTYTFPDSSDSVHKNSLHELNELFREAKNGDILVIAFGGNARKAVLACALKLSKS